MELGTARTISQHYTGATTCDDSLIEQRLNELLRLNADIAREKALSRTDSQRIDPSLMTSPIDSRKVYSYFGLMIGALPPYSLALKVLSETIPYDRFPILLIALLVAAGLATGIVAYVTGRFIPAAVSRASRLRLPNSIAVLSMIGLA